MPNLSELIDHTQSLRTSRRFSLPYDLVGFALASFEIAVIVMTSIASGVSYRLFTAKTIGLTADNFVVGCLVAVLYCSFLNGKNLYSTSYILNAGLGLSKLLAVWTAAF